MIAIAILDDVHCVPRSFKNSTRRLACFPKRAISPRRSSDESFFRRDAVLGDVIFVGTLFAVGVAAPPSSAPSALRLRFRDGAFGDAASSRRPRVDVDTALEDPRSRRGDVRVALARVMHAPFVRVRALGRRVAVCRFASPR